MPPSSAVVRMTSWGFSLGGEQGLDAGFASEVETVEGARLLNPRIWSLQDNGRADEAAVADYEYRHQFVRTEGRRSGEEDLSLVTVLRFQRSNRQTCLYIYFEIVYAKNRKKTNIQRSSNRQTFRRTRPFGSSLASGSIGTLKLSKFA
ncbi:hypothetical protein ACFX14_031626 [Malus domestica]